MQKFQYPVLVLLISIGVSRAIGEEIHPLGCIGPVHSKEQIARDQWNKWILSVDAWKNQKLKVGITTSLGCPMLSNVEIC